MKVIAARQATFIAFFVAFWVIARLWMAHTGCSARSGPSPST
jgi:hypothetical protein